MDRSRADRKLVRKINLILCIKKKLYSNLEYFSDCVQRMQANALSPRICDGVADCEDLSDEKSCTYCTPGHLHCGIGRSCFPPSKRCDGVRDCPNGSDEKSCCNYIH